MDSSSRTRNASSAALSSIAAFSRKHLVPPTPTTSSSGGSGIPSSRSYTSSSPRGSLISSMDIKDPSSRFQGLKRSLNLKPLAHRRPTTSLNTPEEERGHGQARPNMPSPPTIQQIASGLATRATSSISGPFAQRPRTNSRNPQSPFHNNHSNATHSASASSSTSSVTIPSPSNHPVPLRSALKKTSTNSSVASSLAISSSTAPTSLQSGGSRRGPQNLSSFPPKVTAVRNLFASLHGHARHNLRNGGATGLSINRVGSRSDDGGSVLSDNSRVRRVGRVRFSDDDDEHEDRNKYNGATARMARTVSDPNTSGISAGGAEIGAPPVIGADTATPMPLVLPPLSALPARLINTKKTVIKIFHRVSA